MIYDFVVSSNGIRFGANFVKKKRSSCSKIEMGELTQTDKHTQIQRNGKKEPFAFL